MALPINIENAAFSLDETGYGAHKDTMAEIAKFSAKPVEPITGRRVAGHKGVKLDQRFEKWEGSFEANITSLEAIESAKRNQDAYIAGRAMPRRTITIREEYRDTGGAVGKYQFLNMLIEHDPRDVGENGMAKFNFQAERMVTR